MNSAYAVVQSSGQFSGSGISNISNPDTGTYLVEYSADFSASPGVSATPWGNQSLCSLNIFAENMCEVMVTDLQGNPTNNGFSFLAVGD